MSEGKRIILALALSIGVITIWQKYFTPDTPSKKIDIRKSGSIEPKNENINSGSIEPKPKSEKELKSERIDEIASHKVFEVVGHKASYKIDNYLRVLAVNNDISKFDFNEVTGGGKKGPQKILFKNRHTDGFEALSFEEVSNIDGILILNSPKGMQAVIKVDEKGMLDIDLSSSYKYELKFYLNSSEKVSDGGSVRSFVALKKALVTYDVGDEEKEGGMVKWFGIDFDYHLFATVFSKKNYLNISTYEKGLLVATTNGLFEGEEAYNFNFKEVYTLKNYNYLNKLGNNLDLSVDFGIWSILAIPMLKALKFFYSFLENWGLAIIFLTICMRLLTFPLQYKSFKSMKRMQLIQPQIKAINERYKNDMQKKQMETMALFKREGVNPLGGCLPMLFQLPIFIAFYRMLGAAVELVGAPFYFWITDLSTKDPYYALPVLVTVVMFLQQKLTPTTTTDPTQQKVMMFMPLIFGFILKDLPSGLNLYIFVSTTLGIVLQKAVFAQIGPKSANKA